MNTITIKTSTTIRKALGGKKSTKILTPASRKMKRSITPTVIARSKKLIPNILTGSLILGL
jgi:hypothetical protein